MNPRRPSPPDLKSGPFGQAREPPPENGYAFPLIYLLLKGRDYINPSPFSPVVVKDKIGRRRYIVARNSPRLKKLIYEIRRIDERAKIIYFDDRFAVIRCRHWYKERIIEFLKERNIETYRTTGTIKKAKKIIVTLNSL